MHDSINHGITVTPSYVSKINKTPQILVREFLGYFTSKTGERGRRKKKHLGKKHALNSKRVHLFPNKSNSTLMLKNKKKKREKKNPLSA